MKIKALAVLGMMFLAACSSSSPPTSLPLQTAAPAVAEPLPTESAASEAVVVPPNPMTKVPDFEGDSLQDARKAAKKANVRVSVSKKKVSSEPEGTVISQSPKAGAKVEERSSVRVVLAKAAPESSGGGGGDCTPGYSPCLASASDYDCAGGSGDGPKYVNGTVTVTGADPYDLDSDGDGYGCE